MSKSILLVSYFAPSRAHAGGVRLLDLYQEIRCINPNIKLEMLTCHHVDADWGGEEHYKIFNAIHFLEESNFLPEKIDYVSNELGEFDIIDLQYHQSGKLISFVRNRWPNAIIIYSVMESLSRSMLIQISSFFLWGSKKNIKRIIFHIKLALQEFNYIKKSDKVVCVSDADLKVVSFMQSLSKFTCIPTCLSEIEFPNEVITTFSKNVVAKEKKMIVAFVAYFKSETNREALRWYCKEIHTRLFDLIPSYEFHVIGFGLDQRIMQECQMNGIKFVGAVENLYSCISQADVGIAPALSGAGIRGKIHQYAAIGLPCVASEIAHHGLKYVHNISIMSARNANEFFHSLVSLLNNSSLRIIIGMEAKKTCYENYKWSAIHDKLSSVYELN